MSQKLYQDLQKLTVQQASICISEPPDSPKSQQSGENDNLHILMTQQSINSLTPSPPPPPISISSGSPPSSPQPTLTEDKENLMIYTTYPETIKEEIHENGIAISGEEVSTNNKSSLSLPVDQLTTNVNNNNNNTNSIGTHRISVPERTNSDRRKLSVTGLMGFSSERRKSSGSIFSDMRKMSITNFDSIKSPGIGNITFFYSSFMPFNKHNCNNIFMCV